MKYKTVLLRVVVAMAVLLVYSYPQSSQAAFPGANGKIAFHSQRDGNYEIYTMSTDGASQTRITNNTATDVHPIWSPDGKEVVFRSDRDGNTEIYKMKADGTALTNLSNNAAAENYPAWSPDGQQIIFESSRNGNVEIYKMDADGSNQTRLTNNTATDSSASWSPDGTKIAFHSNRDGNYEIYTMNIDGTSPARLTTATGSDLDAVWAPNGLQIAFYANRDGNTEIYKMNADGSSQTRLTNNATGDSLPAWSPDGSKITYTGTPQGIHSINNDGTGNTQLSTMNDSGSDWQPLIGTTISDANGRFTTTIAPDESYPILDYVVESNQTVVLNGQMCDITVESGGILKGAGTSCTVFVETGGSINPGQSPGCFNSGNTTLNGTYLAELSTTTVCAGYDQIQVTGTVELAGLLEISLLNNFKPAVGDRFTIINNDGSDVVNGTFDRLTENSTFVRDGVSYRVSYMGGDGNDVTLTVLASSLPGLPVTGFLPNNIGVIPVLGLGALVGLIVTSVVLQRRVLVRTE